MTSIFERTATALATLSPAVPFAMSPYQGTLPSRYIVYQLLPSSAEEHADNQETARSYTIQITVWDTTGLAALPAVDTVMQAADFQKGDQRQLPKDQQSGHYGLATDFLYVDKE